MSKKRPQAKKKKGKKQAIFQSQNYLCHFSATWLHKGPDPQDHPSAKSC